MQPKELAERILELVGGKENISYATYCMTRLRLNLKDRGRLQDDAIKSLQGIIGTKYVGSQYQVIIGPNVDHVYKEFCKIAGLEENQQIQETDAPVAVREKLTAKKVLDNIMDAIGGCVAPMLPIITAAGLLKMFAALLGPKMLNILPVTSDLMRLLTFAGDAGFYFFPIYVAYGGAKKFNANIPMSLFIACILMHPSLLGIVQEGKPFTVFGIPMVLTSYATSFIPMILITWVMSYVEKGINKIIPNSLRTLLYPLLLTIIMLPLSLCVLGPVGTLMGQGIAKVIMALHSVLGPVATGVIAAVWPLLIATGMHQALIAIALTHMGSVGYDVNILVGGGISLYCLMAIALAFMLKAKNTEDRGYGSSSFITIALGGISEPTIFGILLRYKRAILYLIAGGFVGGAYAAMMHVAVYFVSAGNLLAALCFAGENPASLLHGTIGCVIAFVISFVLAMIFGFDSNKPIHTKKRESIGSAE